MNRMYILFCVLGLLMALVVRMSMTTHAAPPFQEPTPTIDVVKQMRADNLLGEGDELSDRSDFWGALEKYEEALSIYQSINDQEGEAITLGQIGLVYNYLGEFDRALELFQQALELVRIIDYRDGEGPLLSNIGLVYYGMGEFKQAIRYYEQALVEQREMDNRVGEATTLSNIGEAYRNLGAYENALDYCQQALPILQEIGDQLGEASTLNTIGVIYIDLADYERASNYLQKALQIQDRTGDRAGQAVTLGNIGTARYYQGDYHQALVSYQEALDIQLEIGDELGRADTLTRMGAAYTGLAEYQRAVERLQGALDVQRQKSDQSGQANTLTNIGAVYYYQGSYQQALEYCQQALEIEQRIGDKKSQAFVLINIGAVYNSLGNYRQALQHYQQALGIAQLLPDRYSQAVALNNIGVIYADLGEYEIALKYFEQSLPVRRNIGDQLGEAATLHNIGATYEALREYSKALEYYRQALFLRRTVGDQRGEAITLNGIGHADHYLGKHDQALEYHQQALRIQREIGDRTGEAMSLLNTGSVYEDLGDYWQAQASYQEALSISQEIGDRRGEARALGSLADICEVEGQKKQALEYALQAIAVLESIHGELRVEALQAAFAVSTADYYHHAVRLLLTQGHEAEAFHYAERGRARTLLTLLGNQRVNPKGSEDPDLIQQEVQLRSELAAWERQLQEEWSKPADQRSQEVLDHITANLEARRQEYKELLTQLQSTNPEYAALVGVGPLTLEEAHALLREQAPDVTMVAYFVGEEEMVIFVVGLETFRAQAVAVTRQDLRQQAEALLAQMKARPLLPDAWQESAQALHKWLITPIQEHLPPADSDSPPRLGIIPHDLLHYLPFGLLYDGENTLLDGYTLFYGPSVSSLRFIFEKRHPDADTLLAFANPDAPGAPHLHYAVEEAQAVATLYGTQPFIGSDATEGRFKAQAGEYGVVHVAAHSDYNPQSPLFSAILLQTGEDEDGRLETHEVFNLHLPQADLVVLSACETHLGELGAGDELVGLERAFVRAGSPSLLSTLWPVDDAATAALMERFYTHLRAGVPKAEALRLAQIETRAEHPEPYYWAGFVLVGDVGARPAAQPSRWIWEWGAVIALLLAVGVVGWQIRRRKRHK